MNTWSLICFIGTQFPGISMYKLYKYQGLSTTVYSISGQLMDNECGKTM